MLTQYNFQDDVLILGVLVGLFVMADTIKPEAPVTVATLLRMRMGVYLLTGDNRHTAQAIASQVVNISLLLCSEITIEL